MFPFVLSSFVGLLFVFVCVRVSQVFAPNVYLLAHTEDHCRETNNTKKRVKGQ